MGHAPALEVMVLDCSHLHTSMVCFITLEVTLVLPLLVPLCTVALPKATRQIVLKNRCCSGYYTEQLSATAAAVIHPSAPQQRPLNRLAAAHSRSQRWQLVNKAANSRAQLLPQHLAQHSRSINSCRHLSPLQLPVAGHSRSGVSYMQLSGHSAAALTKECLAATGHCWPVAIPATGTE